MVSFVVAIVAAWWVGAWGRSAGAGSGCIAEDNGDKDGNRGGIAGPVFCLFAAGSMVVGAICFLVVGTTASSSSSLKEP